MCTLLCPDVYLDHYVLFCPDPKLIVTLRYRCVIIHEVDVSKDVQIPHDLTLLCEI